MDAGDDLSYEILGSGLYIFGFTRLKIISAYLLAGDGVRCVWQLQMERESIERRRDGADERHAGHRVEIERTDDQSGSASLRFMSEGGIKVESDDVSLGKDHDYQSSFPTDSAGASISPGFGPL